MAQDRFRIELLAGHHKRGPFSSGVAPLDDYLHRYAQQDIQRRLAVVYVLFDNERDRVAGYYTLSSYAVDPKGLPETLSRRLPRRPVPVVLLGRLATDVEYRGQGFGRRLLIDALQRALYGSQQIAAMAVIVDAKDEAVRSFYEHYGFQRFNDDPYRLVIPMRTIARLLA